jgi:hypothetical protein
LPQARRQHGGRQLIGRTIDQHADELGAQLL